MLSTGIAKLSDPEIYLVRSKANNYDSFNRVAQTLCFEVVLEQKGCKMLEELVTLLYSVGLILKICSVNLLEEVAHADGV